MTHKIWDTFSILATSSHDQSSRGLGCLNCFITGLIQGPYTIFEYSAGDKLVSVAWLLGNLEDLRLHLCAYCFCRIND